MCKKMVDFFLQKMLFISLLGICCLHVSNGKPTIPLSVDLIRKNQNKTESIVSNLHIDEQLEVGANKYPNDMAYQAGFAEAKAILLPIITALQTNLNSLSGQQLKDRRMIAKLYAITKIRSYIEKYEKSLGIPLKPFTKAFVEEAYISVSQFIDSLQEDFKEHSLVSELKGLWQNYTEFRRSQLRDAKMQKAGGDDPFSNTKDQITHHYNLWRNIVERSTDPMMISLRKKYPDPEQRSRICAKIAAMFLFDSKDIHTPQTYDLTDEEVIKGLEESLGIYDEELLTIAKAMLNGFLFD